MKSTTNLNKQLDRVGTDMGTLAEDARALMAATAHVAGDKVEEARKRLEDVLDKNGDIYEGLKGRACRGAKIAGETVREHTYAALGIAVGAGLLLGLLASFRGSGRCS